MRPVGRIDLITNGRNNHYCRIYHCHGSRKLSVSGIVPLIVFLMGLEAAFDVVEGFGLRVRWAVASVVFMPEDSPRSKLQGHEYWEAHGRGRKRGTFPPSACSGERGIAGGCNRKFVSQGSTVSRMNAPGRAQQQVSVPGKVSVDLGDRGDDIAAARPRRPLRHRLRRWVGACGGRGGHRPSQALSLVVRSLPR